MSETKTPWTADVILAHYDITEDGRIFSKTHNWRGQGLREMRRTPNADGYPRVRLTLDGKRKSLAVHTLVAMVYLPPKPTPRHEVRHLDGDKQNPCRSNLAWGTAADNAADREAHGRMCKGERHPRAKIDRTVVVTIRERWQAGDPITAIAAAYGLNPTATAHICHGRNWAHV